MPGSYPASCQDQAASEMSQSAGLFAKATLHAPSLGTNDVKLPDAKGFDFGTCIYGVALLNQRVAFTSLVHRRFRKKGFRFLLHASFSGLSIFNVLSWPHPSKRDVPPFILKTAH